MISKIGRFLVKYEGIDISYVSSFNFEKLEEEYQRLIALYEFKKEIEIRICFLYSSEEYVFFTSKKFENKELWGRAVNGKIIYIFSPSVCEKYTSHKKEQIFNTLIHEMCHIIYYNANLGDSIFNEGLAYYFSGMNKKNINKEKLKLKLTLDYKIDSDNGFFLSKLIIENIEGGKSKIFSFLKESRNIVNEEEVNRIFFKNFNMRFEDLIKLKGGNEK
ncbi:MAG: hypothetical protein WC548_04330 [Candidatus Pacearchaeota archaeon]